MVFVEKKFLTNTISFYIITLIFKLFETQSEMVTRMITKIIGTGSCVPERIVTNDDMARRVDTNDEWIVTRTGIRERRFAREGETLTQFTVAAARQALERSGLKPEDIGLCITATVTPDRLTPAQACLIHQELGLPEDCPAFDLGAGCTGFLYAMEMAAAMRRWLAG